MNEIHLNKYRIVQDSAYCYIHLFIHLGAMTHVGKSEERGELTEPSLRLHLWVPGIKLRLSDLVASTFVCWAIFLAPSIQSPEDIIFYYYYFITNHFK